MQQLVEQCKIRNVFLELRLYLLDKIRNTSGSSARSCSVGILFRRSTRIWANQSLQPFLRLIVDSNGGSEVVEAHMVDKELYGSVKTMFDKWFGCNLLSLKFKPGKRRIIRATEAARSRWVKFGTKFWSRMSEFVSGFRYRPGGWSTSTERAG